MASPASVGRHPVTRITISGRLGGEMVYVHGVAVEPQRDATRGDAGKARVS